MSLIGRILSSPWLPLAGLVRMVAAIALIMIGVEISMFDKIDISNLSIPDEYLPAMLIASIVMGVLFTRAAAFRWYRKGADIAAGEKEDKRYTFCTIFSIILGIAGGMYGAIPVADALFIGAGMWTYTAVAGILSAIFGIMLNYAFQYGVREMVIKTVEVAKMLKETGTEAAEELKKL